MSKDISKQLQSLVRLISFFKQIRHKDTPEKLGFFFVNELFNIIPYRQCILWSYKAGKINLVAASGQISIEKDSPLAQFAQTSIKEKLTKNKYASDKSERSTFIDQNGYAHIENISEEEIKSLSNNDIEEFISPHMTHVTFLENKGVIGGLWMARDKPLGDIERAILEDAGDAAADKMLHFRKSRRSLSNDNAKFSKFRLGLLIAFIIFCLWPVRYSITTTAEVVAKDSTVITVPFEGLIEEINVEPNAIVQKGDVLLSLDKTRLKNLYALSQQALETARENLKKTQREVFLDPTKTVELNLLKEEVKLKTLEVNYAKDRLDLSEVKAKANGVVLFSDKNDLLGKPTKAGEIIMSVADPKNMELLLQIPADSLIELDTETPVRFFLNTAPLKSHKAYIDNISYQPTPSSNGLLAYKARAKIERIEDIEKIGLTGTAKIYGHRTIMILNILRRPFIALRSISII